MLPTAPPLYWTRIINVIIRAYLSETTICLMWNGKIDFALDLREQHVFVNIQMAGTSLRESFAEDVVDFTTQRDLLLGNGVIFNDLVEKLAMSIEQSHCESFIVFQQEIPVFVEAFVNASKYSIWRSQRNKFIFAYYHPAEGTTGRRAAYFRHYFFADQPNILVVEAETKEATKFHLKTNKYVGPRVEQPETLYLLDRFDAVSGRFERGVGLFPDKVRNLQGREVYLAAFEYPPYMIIKHDTVEKNAQYLLYKDGNEEPETIHVYLDGTEAKVLVEFCEKYNCTVVVDNSEADDWGEVYPNGTGYGALGMLIQRQAEITLGAMYAWQQVNEYLDMSMFIVRSGITCIVPAPGRQASWLLPFEPFQLTLWSAVLCCLAFEIVFLFILHLVELKFFGVGTKCESGLWLYSFEYANATTFKLFVSQSSNEYVRTISLRVLLFACFMNDIIITSIYSGGLSSILTIPTYEPAADSLERLESHQLVWGANSVAWISTITGTDDPHMNAILRNFRLRSNEELYEMARTEYMGFTVERLPFGHYAIEQYITAEFINRFKIMEDDIYFQYTVAFVERLWPLLPHFSQLLYMLHSSGINKYWEWHVVVDNLNTYIQKRVEASNFEHVAGPVKLGMSNFAGILLLWAVGVICSLVMFIGELMFQRLATIQ